MDAKPKALVLGGAGFIGGHIAKRLLEDDWEVHVLRRDPGSSGQLGALDVTWHSGDLDQIETLAVPFSQVQFLFHAAGYVPPNSRDVPGKVARSVQQTRNVCESARRAGIKRMVYTSTLTTIGTPPEGAERLADERDSYLPGSVAQSAYFECKFAMESEVLRYAAAGLSTVIVNPTFVLGPGGGLGAIGTLMQLIASGWGRFGIEGDQNVVDVRDVAEGHLQAADHGASGGRYILGGTNIAVNALMSQLAELMDAAKPRFNLPANWLQVAARALNFGPFGAASNHLFGIKYWQALSTEKAERELGYQSQPLEVTLRDTINWYREQGVLPGAINVV